MDAAVGMSKLGCARGPEEDQFLEDWIAAGCIMIFVSNC